MTSEDIRNMSVRYLLDKDYFLNDEDTYDVGKEGFISFNLAPPCFLCPHIGGHYCFKCLYITENGGLSYQKEKRHIYHHLVIG